MDPLDIELAELTAPGRGAVSVLRVQGPDAEAFVRELCVGAEIPAGIPRFARLRVAGEDLDEALVCRLRDGGFELHVHGSPVLVRRLASLVPSGRRPAVEAADLETLAARELEQAPAECAARILLDQAEGALSRELRSLAAADVATRERILEALLARGRAARFALRPAEVVLAGPANAGKSTLFNVLLGESRAIVDEAPGTTRDVLRERALLGGWPVWLVDTAGERDLGGTGDEVEREGQARGTRVREEADLVLRLVPVSPFGDPEALPGGGRDGKTILVRTFADRVRDPALARGAISALHDPAAARARIAELYRRFFALPEDPWVPGQAVPFTEALAAAIAGLRGASGPELGRRVGSILAPARLAFAPPSPPS